MKKTAALGLFSILSVTSIVLTLAAAPASAGIREYLVFCGSGSWGMDWDCIWSNFLWF